jgi:hypothetical protein
MHAGCLAGTLNSYGYWSVPITINGRRQRFLTHRIIFVLTYGHWPTKELDHKNQNKAQSRIANLREATHGENSFNRYSPRPGRLKTGAPTQLARSS